MVEKKQRQISLLKVTLLLTIAGAAAVILFWCYVNFRVGPMATDDEQVLDSVTGLDVIIISAALGFAAAIINFSRLRELDQSKLLQKSLEQFYSKTSQFLYGAQGIFVAHLFTFLFWLWYSKFNHMTKYEDFSGNFHLFTSMNQIWLGIMLVTVLAAALNLLAASSLQKKSNKKKKR